MYMGDFFFSSSEMEIIRAQDLINVKPIQKQTFEFYFQINLITILALRPGGK